MQQESISMGCMLPAWEPYILQWPPPDVAPGGCHQMNKFEEVSGDDHLMPLAGRGGGWCI